MDGKTHLPVSDNMTERKETNKLMRKVDLSMLGNCSRPELGLQSEERGESMLCWSC
jgi:hypothetical protein